MHVAVQSRAEAVHEGRPCRRRRQRSGPAWRSCSPTGSAPSRMGRSRRSPSVRRSASCSRCSRNSGRRRGGRVPPRPRASASPASSPAFTSFAMFAGALLAWIFSRARPKAAEAYTVPVSSGLIAGESLMGGDHPRAGAHESLRGGLTEAPFHARVARVRQAPVKHSAFGGRSGWRRAQRPRRPPARRPRARGRRRT